MKKIFILLAIIMYCCMGIGLCADGFYVIPVISEAKYAIGDTGPGGGIVFYITPGSGGRHGLEAAPADQSSGEEWGCHGTILTGNGTAIGTGGQNSIAIAITMSCGERAAAKVAESYVLNGISGWFLPSKDELNKLYLNKSVVGGFANAYYWSSSQINDSWAWMQFFENGNQYEYFKDERLRVRAVRDF